MYKTMFVIGDLNDDGDEDIDDFAPPEDAFTVSSSNTAVLVPANAVITRVPSDEPYAPLEGPRSYTLTATTEPGIIGRPPLRLI